MTRYFSTKKEWNVAVMQGKVTPMLEQVTRIEGVLTEMEARNAAHKGKKTDIPHYKWEITHYRRLLKIKTKRLERGFI